MTKITPSTCWFFKSKKGFRTYHAILSLLSLMLPLSVIEQTKLHGFSPAYYIPIIGFLILIIGLVNFGIKVWSK